MRNGVLRTSSGKPPLFRASGRGRMIAQMRPPSWRADRGDQVAEVSAMCSSMRPVPMPKVAREEPGRRYDVPVGGTGLSSDVLCIPQYPSAASGGPDEGGRLLMSSEPTGFALTAILATGAVEWIVDRHSFPDGRQSTVSSRLEFTPPGPMRNGLLAHGDDPHNPLQPAPFLSVPGLQSLFRTWRFSFDGCAKGLGCKHGECAESRVLWSFQDCVN